MHSVQQCDLSGIRMLELLRRILKRRGGELYFIRVRRSVLERMQSSGFFSEVGAERFLNEDTAVEQLFHHTLDPAICIYECDRRIFRECHSLPKQPMPGLSLIRLQQAPTAARINARDLWQQLQSGRPPLVIDVREPREYQRGHIPQAVNIPLGRFGDPEDVANVVAFLAGDASGYVTGQVIWTIGSLAANAQAQALIVVRPELPVSVTNVAVVHHTDRRPRCRRHRAPQDRERRQDRFVGAVVLRW
jgi:hypothetical protein